MGIIEKINKTKKRLIQSYIIKGNKTDSNTLFFLKYFKKNKVKSNYILYEANRGWGLTNSPYHLFLYLKKDVSFNKYKHIWILRSEKTKKIYENIYSNYPNIKFVIRGSKEYYKYLAISKILVTNRGFQSLFIKSEKQSYIFMIDSVPNTYIGYDSKDNLRDFKHHIRNIYQSDIVISFDTSSLEIIKNAFKLDDLYKGRLLSLDLKNDLINSIDKRIIKNILNLEKLDYDLHKETILYIPGWNNERKHEVGLISEEYNDLIHNILNNPHNSDFNFFIQVNRRINNKIVKSDLYEKYYIPPYIDGSDMIYISDIIITDDYNVLMQAQAMNKKVILYSPSGCLLSRYIANNQSLKIYDNINDTLENLSKKIDDGEKCDNTKNEDVPTQPINFISEIIENKQGSYMEQHDKNKILFYAGEFHDGGVTHSLLSLLNQIDYKKNDVTLILPNRIVSPYLVNEINSNARIMFQCGRPLVNEFEKFRLSFMFKFGKVGFVGRRLYSTKLLHREYSRIFGEATFDHLIDFVGNKLDFQNILINASSGKKYIWQHTDYKTNFLKKKIGGIKNDSYNPDMLNAIKKSYNLCDKIVGCSEEVMILNRKNISTKSTYDKFTFCSNSVNDKRIFENLDNESFSKNENFLIQKTSQNSSGIINYQKIPFKSKDSNYKFIALGRLTYEKNYFNLIIGFKKMHNDFPNSYLYIIGTGNHEDRLKTLVKSLNLEKNVIFTGLLTNPFPLLNLCDCLLLPSHFEGYPMVILEARVLKLPIIMSNFSTAESIMIKDGQYVVGKMHNDIYEGLKAFTEGKVHNNYSFDVEKYNKDAYKQFLSVLDLQY